MKVQKLLLSVAIARTKCKAVVCLLGTHWTLNYFAPGSAVISCPFQHPLWNNPEFRTRPNAASRLTRKYYANYHDAAYCVNGN